MIQVDDISKIYKVRNRDQFIKSFFTKSSKEVVALDHVSFSINAGETVAYIGVNGAGKSTTIKLLTGILVPSEGAIQVMGKNPHTFRKQICKEIGVVFGQRSQLWWDLPTEDSFRIIASLYGVEEKEYQASLNELDAVLDIKPLFKTPVRQLSLGQRMRCEIAASMIHRPKLLFLDEPTIGLDIFVREKFKDLILQLNKNFRTTVFFTSHNLDEIEQICQRMILINSGRILFDGEISNFKKLNKVARRVELELEDNIVVEELDVFSKPFAGIELVRAEPRTLEFSYDPHLYSSTEIISLFNERVSIKDITIESPTLETILKLNYGDSKAHLK